MRHASNVFVSAFTDANRLLGARQAMGPQWPLREFWKDGLKINRRILDNILRPYCDEAFARKGNPIEGEKQKEEPRTLLLDLVEHLDSKLRYL